MINLLIRLIDSIVWPLVLVLLAWIVFFIDIRFHLGLHSYGMHPQSLDGIYGIFTMPFLHGDFDHLFSNSIPLVLAMGFIFTYFPDSKWHILALNVVVTGVLLLLLGEPRSNHIGASGLVYAFIFFLVTHAFITRNKEMLSASFILIFLYGSLVYGIFPDYGKIIGKNISWEGHLSGALSGVFFGVLYRKRGPQQALFFEGEEEDEDDNDDPDAYWKTPEQRAQETTVHYHYKEKE